MSARIRVRAGLSSAAGSDVKDDILNVKGAKMPFVGAVRIVCERKGVEHDIIEHAMAWVGCRNSYSAVPLGKGLFVVSGDLAEAEVRDLQLMAVAPGPSPEQLARMGAPPNSKDIHVGTGRVPLRAFLEASCGSAGSADENQPRGALMSIGYDPVQPDVELKVQAVPLPEGMRGRFREMNRAALRALSAMEDTLIPMGQDRIHRYNMRQNLISQRFSAELLQRGIKRHPEGVMTGSFVSSIGNTLVDLLTNMDVIMQEKIRLSRTTALDAFGITSSLFRMTGLSFHDRIDARAAADCLANVGGLFASDFTYASDVKPLLAEKTPRDLKPIIERQEGDGYVIEVYEDSEDQEKAPAYAMSEDIMVPFSDIYLRSARVGDAFKGASIGASVKGDTPGESLFNHLDKKRRGYVEGLRRGDCEDLAHMAILQFSYMRRFCVRLSSKCGVIYDEHPDLERMEPAKFAGVVLQSLRAQPELKEWTDDELRGVLRQCGEFGEHIHDTSMRAVLMTAMAAKMSATGKPMNMHPAGHCAAMIVRGKSSVGDAAVTPGSPVVSSSAENDQSSYDRILTELTTAVRIESFAGRGEVVGQPSAYVSQKIQAAGGPPTPLTEAAFYNQCTMLMAPSREMKPWMHIGKLDGIFWHVVSTIGDTILVKNSVAGVPISDAVSTSDSSLRGIKIDFTEEEKKETLLMARYALPPIESSTALIGKKLDRPLGRCLYGPDTIPISYVLAPNKAAEVASWVGQNMAQRYQVTLGGKIIAVHQMNKCAMKGLRESLMKKDRVNFVSL